MGAHGTPKLTKMRLPKLIGPIPEILTSRYLFYIQLEKNLSHHTLMAYHTDLQKYMRYLAENYISYKEINIEELDNYVQWLYNQDQSATSIARALCSLRSFYRYLHLEGEITTDPTELLDSPNTARELPDVLSIEEINRLTQIIDTTRPEGVRDRAIIELLYSSGLRVSELCNLKLTDLFIEEGYMHITGKGRKDRLVPVSPEAIKQLEQWFDVRCHIKAKPGEGEYVFISNSRGRHLSRITIFHNIKQYADDAEISKEISPHTFRHSFATHLYQGGANLYAIQLMLGHESITTTEIYTHINNSQLRAAIQYHHPRNIKHKEI